MAQVGPEMVNQSYKWLCEWCGYCAWFCLTPKNEDEAVRTRRLRIHHTIKYMVSMLVFTSSYFSFFFQQIQQNNVYQRHGWLSGRLIATCTCIFREVTDWFWFVSSLVSPFSPYVSLTWAIIWFHRQLFGGIESGREKWILSLVGYGTEVNNNHDWQKFVMVLLVMCVREFFFAFPQANMA